MASGEVEARTRMSSQPLRRQVPQRHDALRRREGRTNVERSLEIPLW